MSINHVIAEQRLLNRIILAAVIIKTKRYIKKYRYESQLRYSEVNSA